MDPTAPTFTLAWEAQDANGHSRSSPVFGAPSNYRNDYGHIAQGSGASSYDDEPRSDHSVDQRPVKSPAKKYRPRKRPGRPRETHQAPSEETSMATSGYLQPPSACRTNGSTDAPSARCHTEAEKVLTRPGSATSNISTNLRIPPRCEDLKLDDSNLDSDSEEGVLGVNQWSPHSEGTQSFRDDSIHGIWSSRESEKAIRDGIIEHKLKNAQELAAHKDELDGFMPAYWDGLKQFNELRARRSCGDLRSGAMI
ncbi:hypothetical protein I302_103810 [Kwoniella bestiolae CBS 10118]|uniref:Uncharacterized protein n=1 Tax=Kwoniella bestiolae CBS 10118 TaxID=1296100 RepID=A0A1B9G9H6_9TREE|nr:hypothetical protein I302_02513 [Kwoniella bestiolae CBS 10118]OCF27669.1 hypothetical protein I302_02513 [Kwoniella bestiolae CBS 10118]